MAKVYEYRDLYAEGRDLGALTVFQDDDCTFFDDDGAVVPEGGPPIYTLADGFHRHHAAVLAGITELPCDVYRGNTRDAILYATSHNLHGQPLSNADKRRRVQTLLDDPEWQQWSDNQIARHCGLSQTFVSSIRRSLKTVLSEPADMSLKTMLSEDDTPAPTTRTFTNRYGQTSTMIVDKIGHRTPVTTDNGMVAPAPPPLFAEVAEEPQAEPAPTFNRSVTGSPEWYTPPEVIALEREVLGTIDLDPASCAEAQKTVQATRYYTTLEDGLRQPWYRNIHLNPPFDDVARWGGKLLTELDAGRATAAIMITNNNTEADWFQTLAARAQLLCFPDGRLHFSHPEGKKSNTAQGQAIFYFGPHPERFAEVFGRVGLIMQVSRAKDSGPQLDLADAAAPADRADRLFMGQVWALMRPLHTVLGWDMPALGTADDCLQSLSDVVKAVVRELGDFLRDHPFYDEDEGDDTPPPPPLPPPPLSPLATKLLDALKAHAPEGYSQTSGAKAIGTKQGNTSQAWNQLLARGYVRKEGALYFYVKEPV
jgi:hypothetical protein